ncbi:large-conductance mechanosensitive channel protein MscL [Falsibacillus pallidus]|uniref:large-conductance mechanosensitive channel protein MscL n=1 Tax=Falsibacillus pallidus TaxID=493781 RepID=UPI003D995DD4
MWQEFKKFGLKGNVMDLAIGVIIGAAFSKIVTSLVNDIITPIVGILLGGIDISKLSIDFYKAHITYGAFLQSVVDFFIVAFSIFFFVRLIQQFKRKEQKPSAPKTDPQELLLREIRDILKEQNVERGQ